MMGTPSTASLEWQFNPPEEVLQSRLFAAEGYMVVSGLFDEATLDGLRAEADAARAEAFRGGLAVSDGAEGRGGSPAHAYGSGWAGNLHWSLHRCRQMTETLSRLCGVTLSASGKGSYSYYERTGDFLAVHRDVLQCDIALVTCLTHSVVDGSTGELAVYPEFMREPLSKARASGSASAMPIPLYRGQTAILLGGLLPHEVIPTCPGQQRIVALNCYRVETACG